MNVLTSADLNAAGAPLLRTGSENEDDEEFLLATFGDVAIHFTASDEGVDEENECMTEELPLNRTKGVLYITTKRIVWVGDRAAVRVGYGWDVSQITLHAISRDPAAFDRPCLYCQVGIDEISEVRFVPSEEKQLSEIFTAFSKSAEMNPDDESDNDDGEDEGWIYDEDEVADGARAAEIAAHLDSVLHIAPGLERPTGVGAPVAGQFDDADEDELL